MVLKNFLNKKQPLVAIDIGSSYIKLAEVDPGGDKPVLETLAVQPSPAGAFQGHLPSKPDEVSAVISKMVEANGVENEMAVFSLPSPSVFSKKIKVPYAEGKELEASVRLEAGSFIPHKLESVSLSYHVLREVAKGQLEILVVAVKKEVLSLYEGIISGSGLIPAIADVDYCALYNVLDTGKERDKEKVTALIHIGYRFSIIEVIKGDDILINSDFSIGIHDLLDEATQSEEVDFDAVSNALKDFSFPQNLQPLLDKFSEKTAKELSRQINFLWNASGSSEKISKMMVSGSLSTVPSFIKHLSEISETEVSIFNPLMNIELSPDLDAHYAEKHASIIAPVIGLGLRQLGDMN